MKVTIVVSAALLMISANVSASDAITQLSVASIKQTLSQEQIESKLNSWYQNELMNIDATASSVNDRVPLIVRKRQARESLEQQYANLKTKFDL